MTRRWAAVGAVAVALAGCGSDPPKAAPTASSTANPPPVPTATSSTAKAPPTTDATTSGATGGATGAGADAASADPPRPPLPADLAVSFVGEGSSGAWVIRRRASATDPVLLFLHGWTAVSPALYGPWVAHLARRGSTVVYPVYQDAPFLAPSRAFDGVVAGVRAALGQARPRLSRQGWVVAGHSAGGAMSADYAVRAAALGLPRARAVFSAYPGRMIRGIPLKLPEVDPAGIPAATRLVALYSPRDATVGSTTAVRTFRQATRIPRARRTLVRITDPAVDDHLGPQRSGPVTRRTFWRRLDALVDDVR